MKNVFLIAGVALVAYAVFKPKPAQASGLVPNGSLTNGGIAGTSSAPLNTAGVPYAPPLASGGGIGGGAAYSASPLDFVDSQGGFSDTGAAVSGMLPRKTIQPVADPSPDAMFGDFSNWHPLNFTAA